LGYRLIRRSWVRAQRRHRWEVSGSAEPRRRGLGAPCDLCVAWIEARTPVLGRIRSCATVESVVTFADNLAAEALWASLDGVLSGQDLIDYFLGGGKVAPEVKLICVEIYRHDVSVA